MKKILIIELRPGIGDLCMFLPRFHEIKQKFQNSHITLLTKTRTKAKEILKFDKNIDRIEFIDTGVKKKNIFFLFSLFKKGKFDLVFSYQYGPKYLKYIFLSKIFGSKVFYYGIFKRKESMMKRAIKSNEVWLGIKINNRSAKIFIKNQSQIKKNQIIIGLGASGDNKRWPTDYFNLLIDHFKNKNFEFILAGGPGEIKIIDHIKKYHSGIKFISLEKLSLEESLEIIKDAKFHFGNDSGFMHICAALGMTSYCFYGDTPSEDSFYNDKIIPVIPDNFERVYHGSRAMNLISVTKVIKTFEKYH
tara:strand:- start:166 stop:1077 length:912 start_codon:yes stop_codon:yes gene_type:complete